jgi:hypothetical protein
LSSVKLKSKYVPFAFIVVDIESLGSVANEIDVTPVNVM